MGPAFKVVVFFNYFTDPNFKYPQSDICFMRHSSILNWILCIFTYLMLFLWRQSPQRQSIGTNNTNQVMQSVYACMCECVWASVNMCQCEVKNHGESQWNAFPIQDTDAVWTSLKKVNVSGYTTWNRLVCVNTYVVLMFWMSIGGKTCAEKNCWIR